MAELHMDEKWKLSKKGSRNNGSRKVSIAETNTIGSSNGNGNGNQYLKRSESAREARSSSRSNPRSFSSRCANLVKEQRAKFYIMRRCVTMLVCWKDYA